jgi:hypothetical protein
VHCRGRGHRLRLVGEAGPGQAGCLLPRGNLTTVIVIGTAIAISVHAGIEAGGRRE